MSEFCYALHSLLRKYKKETADLAKACKFPEQAIRDWSTNQALPWPGHIISLARAFATSPDDTLENHLALLYARLQDDCCGPAAKYINIEILKTALPIVAGARSFQPIHRRSERDLEAIRKHIWYDEQLQRAVRAIAKPLKTKPVPKSLDAPTPARDPQPPQDPPLPNLRS